MNNIKDHPKNETLKMDDGDEIGQEETFLKKIEEEYEDLFRALGSEIEDWELDLNRLGKEIDDLPKEEKKQANKRCESLTTMLIGAAHAMKKALYKKQEYAHKSRLLQEVGNITADLIGDRRQVSPSTPIHHTDPLEDLRLINPRIHASLQRVIQETPALRIMICHLIYRIQHIQETLDEMEANDEGIRMASESDIDGPLTPLWEQIPSSPDPSRFTSQYTQWCALENRMWYLLKNPLETRIR